MDPRVCCLLIILTLLVMRLMGYIFGVDGCSMVWPDACKDVECPNGQTCTPYSEYWCGNMMGSICMPRGRCDENADPCTAAKCSSEERCVLVLDQCQKKGGCTFRAQCNEIKRSGSCPRPEAVLDTTTSCANSCDDDAACETGAKCCLVGGPFGKVYVAVRN